jgi:Flp pilus assembly protein TadD
VEQDIKAKTKKLIDSGMYHEAKELLLNVIQQQPEDIEAYNKLGVIMAQQGQCEQAEKYFKKALELDPGNSSAVSNMGNIYYETGDLDKAEKYYKTALRIDPDNPLPYNNLAVIYKKKKKIDLFVRYYKKSLNLQRRKDLVVGRQEQRDINKKFGLYRIIMWLLGIILLLVIFTYFK